MRSLPGGNGAKCACPPPLLFCAHTTPYYTVMSQFSRRPRQVRRKSSTGSESAAKEEAIASSKNASTATTATISSNNGTDNDVDNSNSNNNNSNANGVPNALTSPSPDSREENGNGNESAINSNTINTELKATKDNLKSFIERWEEHPNSPYVFDTDAHCISPVFADTIGDAVVAGQQQPDEAMMMSTVSLCNGGSSSVLSSRGTFEQKKKKTSNLFDSTHATGNFPIKTYRIFNETTSCVSGVNVGVRACVRVS